MHITELPTPALLLDLDVLERNLARMQARAARAGVRLRPHVKTHKCIEIARRQRALGAAGITVSTLAEAEAFARAGFDDLTWALPNPLSHLAGALDLAARATLRLLIDDLGALRAIEAACAAAGRTLHAWLKVDCGYHRAGVDPASAEAVALLQALARSPTLAFDGILTHAGHGYHAATRAALEAIAAEERDVMRALKARAAGLGITVPEISIGSTPTIGITDTPEVLAGIDEIRPGNYVFFDFTQVALGSCTLADCALTVAASVISHPPGAPRFVTDAGALALSKDPGPDHLPGLSEAVGMGRIFADYPARRLWDDVKIESLSQEHGVLSAPTAPGRFAVGERVRILEHHACLTAAQFDAYWVVRGEEVVDRWRIERQR